MNNLESQQGPWKVGELASLTGITVKTLHHYDKIGLLVPQHHTDCGHRLYTHKELEHLQQIVTLKHLGFSLEQISEAISRPDFSPLRTIADLRAETRRRISELDSLEKKLGDIEQTLSSRQQVDYSQSLFEAINWVTMQEKYLTSEQINKTSEIERSFTPERVKEMVKVEFPALIGEIMQEMDQGTPPSHPTVRKLAVRWMKLVEEKTRGDTSLQNSYGKMLQSEPSFAKDTAKVFGHPGADIPKIMSYLGEALK